MDINYDILISTRFLKLNIIFSRNEYTDWKYEERIYIYFIFEAYNLNRILNILWEVLPRESLEKLT